MSKKNNNRLNRTRTLTRSSRSNQAVGKISLTKRTKMNNPLMSEVILYWTLTHPIPLCKQLKLRRLILKIKRTKKILKTNNLREPKKSLSSMNKMMLAIPNLKSK